MVKRAGLLVVGYTLGGRRPWPGLMMKEPTRVRPQLPRHQTCHIMLIYGDGWTALSTESGQVHQRIYLLTRLKGVTASAKQRPTLGVNAGPGWRDLHWDNLQTIGTPRKRQSRLIITDSIWRHPWRLFSASFEAGRVKVIQNLL